MDNSDIVQFNDQRFYFNVILLNSKGQTFKLASSSIKELVINDDMFSFYDDGHIVIENIYDVIEKSYDNNETVVNGFDFNNSDRDYIYVEIFPLVEDENKDALDPKVWNLKNLFLIYDKEDIAGISPDVKYKKIHFKDTVYFDFLEKNVEFSTALLKNNDETVSKTPASQRTDLQNKEFTGICIKELIKTVISEDVKFDEDWDEGSSQLFYTSNPQNKAIDDLEHLLNSHISSEKNLYDFCLLGRERYTGIWYLTPFNLFMRTALNESNPLLSGKNLLEKFVIVEIGNVDEKNLINRQRVPQDHEKNLAKNMYFSEYSKIDKYELFDMAFIDNQKHIKTRIGHTYDYKKGEFVIKSRDGNILNVKKDFTDIYADKLKNPYYKNFPLINLDSNRRNNWNISHDFTTGDTSEDLLYHITRNKVLKSGILYNLGINFEVRGLTSRQSGKFFSVSKDNKYVDCEYEGKLQGQWILTKVQHIFRTDNYINTIMGVKINKFREV